MAKHKSGELRCPATALIAYKTAINDIADQVLKMSTNMFANCLNDKVCLLLIGKNKTNIVETAKISCLNIAFIHTS